jgi:hypothetical protein
MRELAEEIKREGRALFAAENHSDK